VIARDERPLRDVPRWLWALLALTLATQALWRSQHALTRLGFDLPPPPSAAALRLAALGENAAASRLGMLYVQAFDLGGTNELPYRKLDYSRLAGWLRTALAVDPRSDYPLFLATRVYAEVPDRARMRIMLDLAYQAFLLDPDRRWPWLAQAALLAKHRLKDLPLALVYARAIEQRARAPDVPLWARQMEIFILEDMNELEAARVMLGGLLASGRITDPAESRFLERRLEELEARAAAKVVK
jgi:hypothetical protein